MQKAIQHCARSQWFFVLENGFRFDFPASIANELSQFLKEKDDKDAERNKTIIGDWVLALPFNKRMKVSIQLTPSRV